MTAARGAMAGYLVALALLVACVGAMVAMSTSPPPRPRPKPEHASEKLEVPRDIQGVPCTGYASFAADGRLTGCILARDHAFAGVTLPANTQVRRFHQDLMPKDVHLGKDTVLDGHDCLGRGPGEWMAGFHPNGRLAYCFLSVDETIDGVPCRHGSFWGEITGGVGVSFHDDGRLESCRLAAGVTIAGQSYEKGARIALDREGRVLPASERKE